VEELRPAIGSVLASKYRVDSVLGAGGMGVVLAATHLQLREQVAIKLLHAETATGPDAVERFLREARVAMKLRGEHVVRVLDVGTLECGAPFIAMECLRGSDLGAVLRAEGRLPPALAVDYVLQACEAIAEAHALGVIHRDLKPANLFLARHVDGSPCVKVLDFGISKISGAFQGVPDALTATAKDPEAPVSSKGARTPAALRGHGVTGTRALLGSPRYMAPEQLRSPRDVDVRADVWALGAILFELVVGKPPFEGETLEEIRAAVTGRPPPALPGAPPGLQSAVWSCLAKDPADRCPSVAALVEAMAPFASSEGTESVKRVLRIARGSCPAQATASSQGGRTDGQLRTDEAGAGHVKGPRRAVSFAVVLIAVALGAAAMAMTTRARSPARPMAVISNPTPATTEPDVPSTLPAIPVAASVAAQAPAAAGLKRTVRPQPPKLREPATVSSAPIGSAIPAAAPTNAPPDPLKLDAGFLFSDRK
jgi:serine/threonine-protein kinase